ncbi:AMP nucleosidase [Rhizobium ruizarguesonis]|uniref:AMP nucleosidase n=1 Tax=Rhizobium ruizarguesonis TaxID=2081791 RepID=UPI001031F66D|nr:AMP nucleosidase [Rhizobium ruizarguesonis]NEI27703.1 AMP nucleosidase [Rhizobium ruizarguesonis]TAY92924.1 AMP nucleosidase [Rhizobium ruizarguesonis]TAZ77697.1 AMP nucleosidase [Rhizobium ruizarguesonis]TBA04073.1 AMP nucleosidase [Rhizobium ruizarguesonis]TBA25483.1 AMP nucleosidase [Rhizobium ruizarguesonis]
MNKRISPLSPLDISSPPPFQPQSFDDPAKAVETLTALYERNTAFLIQSFAELAQGAPISSRYRAFYPQVSIETTSFGHVDSRLSYGHVTAPGIYTTTVTRPKLFKHYLNEQLALLMKSHNIPVIVSESTTPIPLHFAFGEGAHVEASTNAFVDIPMRDIFDTPDLNTTDDEIANGEYIPPPGEPSPLAPFTAQRIDYSLARLSHYTATHAEHFQNFVLFTNYQFYIDEFCSWARKLMAEDSDGYTAFVEPGNVVTLPGSNAPETDAALTRLPQMPAYHLKKKGHAGITMINIGVGPSNAKTITDHVAVLRPHAWLMLGHCAGLRNSQRLGDYVLAHAYMREDHVLDDDLPIWVPIPALAEVQVALEAAVAEITGYEGFELKRIMRTGTVGTIDNRNWELRDQRGPVKRLSQARAIALDMESATIAANGFRFRVPYGTLLCVSDKPLHGELKLPGMATAFYRTQVNQHLQIGIRAVQRLAAMPKEALHSRKLRSFFETAFQ